MASFTHKCLIEFYNDNNSRYSIKTNIQILKIPKDEENIKLLFPSKEDVINFEFDTQSEDIFINLTIEKIGAIVVTNKNDFRLNHTTDKYKRRIAYKIKWDIKTDKKKIKVKSIIINKINHPILYEKFEPIAIYST